MKFLFAFVAVFAIIFAAVNAIDQSACTLPKEIGPCRKSDLNFYYNNDSKECEEFFYGGCHGNDNRFQTKEECEQTCK